MHIPHLGIAVNWISGCEINVHFLDFFKIYICQQYFLWQVAEIFKDLISLSMLFENAVR